jgi:hypothetical protein
MENNLLSIVCAKLDTGTRVSIDRTIIELDFKVSPRFGVYKRAQIVHGEILVNCYGVAISRKC